MKPPVGTYADFCDQFLVACADAQDAASIDCVIVETFCAQNFPKAQPTWILEVASTLATIGVGDDESDLSQHAFRINGHGLLMADKIREAGRTKSLYEKLRSVPRSDWIALGALVVAIIALIKPSN